MHKIRRALVGLLGVSTAFAPVLAFGATTTAAATTVVPHYAHRLTHSGADNSWAATP